MVFSTSWHILLRKNSQELLNSPVLGWLSWARRAGDGYVCIPELMLQPGVAVPTVPLLSLIAFQTAKCGSPHPWSPAPEAVWVGRGVGVALRNGGVVRAGAEWGSNAKLLVRPTCIYLLSERSRARAEKQAQASLGVSYLVTAPPGHLDAQKLLNLHTSMPEAASLPVTPHRHQLSWSCTPALTSGVHITSPCSPPVSLLSLGNVITLFPTAIQN